MKPTLGRIVHYRLSAADADAVNRDRAGGNLASEGDICPAVVVRTFGGTAANLQVWLDGDDSYWATSRSEGDRVGSWSWPART